MRGLVTMSVAAALTAGGGGAWAQSQSTVQATSNSLVDIPITNTATTGLASITIRRDTSGRVSDVTISDPSSTTLINTGPGNAATGFVADPTTRFTFAPQGWAIASVLNHSSFGAWINTPNAGGPSVTGAVAGGTPTPVNQVPVTGTATYSGKTFGVGVQAAPGPLVPVVIAGDAAISANFATRQVTTNLNNLTSTLTAAGGGFNTVGTSSPLGSMTGTSSLTGNRYSGAITGTVSVGGADVPAQGALQGGFFGPTAQETAGTWRFAGQSTTASAPISTNSITAVGSFGAVKR